MKQFFVLIFIVNFGAAFCQNGEDLWDIFALNPDTAFVCSNGGSFYRTIDGGDTWEIQNKLLGMSKPIYSIHFLDKNRGWMIHSYDGYIFKTNDGGSSWVVNSVKSSIQYYDLLFLDSLRGWICGQGSYSSGLATVPYGVLKTTVDGGETWIYSYPIGASVRSIFFTSDNIGWLGGRYDDKWGSLSKSVDGGVTWTKQNIPTVNGIEKIFFLDDKRGWAVSNYSTLSQLLHTVDGGETWEIQKEVFVNHINDIVFINDSVGFAIHRYQRSSESSYPGRLIVSSDSGYTWKTHSIYDDRLCAIHFVDENIGWIVGENSLILKTIDSGTNWLKQENFVFINNPDTVDTTDINYILENIELIQNYPNPFNSSTQIDYSVPLPSMVRLKVFDILGNEIETLVSQYQEADRYSIIFNGDKISSGLYFYTLTVDDKYFNTKKMLLIK